MSEYLQAEIERLLEANNAEIERLLAALMFYANREHYEDGQPDCWDPEEDCSDPCSISEDGGLIARQALGIPEPRRVVWTPPPVPPVPEPKTYPCATKEHRYHRQRVLAERCQQVVRARSQISPERMQRFLEVADARA